MHEKELADIKARYEATSVAPWVPFIEGRDCESGSSFIMTGIPKGEDIWQPKRGDDIEIVSGAMVADIDFIAHAKQDIPKLLEEIERLKAMLKSSE